MLILRDIQWVWGVVLVARDGIAIARQWCVECGCSVGETQKCFQERCEDILGSNDGDLVLCSSSDSGPEFQWRLKAR